MIQPAALLDVLPHGFPANRSSAEAACAIVSAIMALPHETRPPVIGINGAQGSGKSSLTGLVALALERFHGLHPALLSLDDFYLGKPPRLQLARLIHPLCETRGVPGTHDTILLTQTLDALAAAGPGALTPMPRFDKLDDDRISREEWPDFVGRPDIVLLEGWCVGLRAEDVPRWAGPINALEAEEDPAGDWVAWSSACLRDEYPAIWDRIDYLVSIQVPDLETVISSRLRQEDGLVADTQRVGMDRAAIVRFVQHYERFTRAIWASMPERADMLLRRGAGFDYHLIKP